MQKLNAPVCAAIDIGSNTIRVVVARCTSTDLDIIATDEALVRVGESVNATGEISAQKSLDAIAVLRTYKALAEKYAAQPILAVATEAIRKARNRDTFLADIERETGLLVHIIGGDVEAVLTFYGATYTLAGGSKAPPQLAVMDLGGGSMELVGAKQLQIQWHTSISIGSGWVHDRYLHADPPSADDFAVARLFLQTYFRGLRIKRFPPVLIATGGSANSLLLLAQRAFTLPAAQQELSRDDLLRCEGLLSALTADEIAQRYQLAPKRARIVSAGAVIIRALLERFQLEALHISPQGIREGLLLAYARFGDDWLQQVQRSAESSADQTKEVVPDQAETFAQTGQYLLLDRAQKMLALRSAVLKNADIEAVHKMRVASRRLRAALDAYEAICEPRAFKKLYRMVKQTADVLGQARDTDVMIEHLQAQLAQISAEEQPGMRWLIDRLALYRQQHQQTLEAQIQQFTADDVKRLVADCLSGLEGVRNGKS